MRPFLPLFLLAGCAAGAVPSAAGSETDLAQELAGRAAGEAQSCLPTNAGQAVAVDARTIVYRGGRILWVNRLASECPGLRAQDRLLVENWGSRTCRGDRIQSIEVSPSMPGPICILGDFIPYRRP